MPHAGDRFRGISAASFSLTLAAFVACNVYNESLLTGGSSGEGGSSSGSGGSDSGEGGSKGGSSGDTGGGSGGEGGSSGKGGEGGASTTGGSAGKGGSSSGGGSGGGSGAMGGTDDMGGEAGQGGTDMGGMGGAGSGGVGGGGASAGSGGKCGVCGCGVEDTDTDMDGVLDCNDTCTGYRDADCDAIEDGLVHRYGFSGSGTTATDSVGTADGTIVNATLAGTGTLTLTGGNSSTAPPYVDLPNGIVSALTNATFEAWLTWNQSGTTGQSWQRIFDFGTSGTEDAQTSGSFSTMSYLFLTPRASTGSPSNSTFLRAAYTTAGNTMETVAESASELPRGTVQHVVLVVDETNGQLILYLGDTVQESTPYTGSLSSISDVNNWLGRSQYSGDYELTGTYDEFRIYDVALTQSQVSTSFAAGPNPPFLP